MRPAPPSLEDGLAAAHGARFVHTLSRCLGGTAAPDTTIHPEDQMFRHSFDAHRDVGAALSQYFNIARQQYDAFTQIADTLLPGRADLRILDFACGFGRLVRFLVRRYAPDLISACEIQPEALWFVADTFGVNTFASAEQPRALSIGEGFDVIWVASLFSHLPDALFRGWLAKLYSLLGADGVLCFSVRPTDLIAGSAAGTAHFAYSPVSERTPLRGDIYGTAYAGLAYVDDVVRTVASGRTAFRIPRALANEQDLYVLPRDPATSLEALRGFQRGPWGWLDVRRLDASRHLSLQGWAGSPDAAETPDLDVRIDGRRFPVERGIARPDVAEACADPRLGNSGWSVEATLDDDSERAWIEVTAGSSGRTALIYAGDVAVAGR